jgi:hypothetical protein
MREIKSNKYLRKEAIYSLDMPVEDPNLPGDMTQRDIPPTVAPSVADSQDGETEIEVDWSKFREWFEESGEPIPWYLRLNIGPSTILIAYEYDYDYNDDGINNIKIKQVKDYDTGVMMTDPYLMESLGEYFGDKIKEDIGVVEEDSKSEQGAVFNPFEQ